MKSQLVYHGMMFTVIATLSTACGKAYRTTSSIDAVAMGGQSVSGELMTPDPTQIVAVNPEAGGASSSGAGSSSGTGNSSSGSSSSTGSAGLSLLEAAPVACGEGSLCFGSKKLQFTNDTGNAVAVNVSSIYANGFSANFTTPSGRHMYLHFTIVNGSLVTSLPQGWNPQFCYRHGPVNKCAVDMVFGVSEVNCYSALHWNGSYNGDTNAQKVVCQ